MSKRDLHKKAIQAARLPRPKFKVGDWVLHTENPTYFGRVTYVVGYDDFLGGYTYLVRDKRGEYTWDESTMVNAGRSAARPASFIQPAQNDLFRATKKLAADNPSLRRHLVPLLKKYAEVGLRDPDLMGQTLENRAGNIRFQVTRSAIRVWDLTNAGRRGKTVNVFALHDLDYHFGPLYPNSSEAEAAEKLREDVMGWPNKLKSIDDYQTALRQALKFIERSEGPYPKIFKSSEKGVHVNPAGFKPFKEETPEFSIRADPRSGYTIRDKRDKYNEPACFSRGKSRDMKRFFRWVQDNWNKGAKIKGMTYAQLTHRMLDEGFDFRSYCGMD